MRAYCDDRAAALALAASLQHENDLLRAENEHLRGLVDPGASRWREAVAQVSSAAAVALMLLGAMVGAGLIVEQTASAAEANVTRGGELDARLAVASPHAVVVDAAPPAPAAAPAPSVSLPDQVIQPAAPRRHHRRHGLHRHRRHGDQG